MDYQYVKKNEWATAVPPPPPSSSHNMLRRTAGRQQTPPLSRSLQNEVDGFIRTIDKIPTKLDKESLRLIKESEKRYRIGDGKLKPYGDFMASLPQPKRNQSEAYNLNKYYGLLKDANDGLDYAESQLEVISQHINIARNNLNLIQKNMADIATKGHVEYTLKDKARYEVLQQMRDSGVALDDLDSPTRQLMMVDGGASKTRRRGKRRWNRTTRKMN